MERLNLLGAEEFTVECNPATVSPDKAKLLRDFGVNRISMGVQSLDEKLLDRLGRIHSREQVFKSFDILRRAGFDNVNLDLMFAIPSQTMEIWCDTLNEAIAMQSEHLSSYEVIYEDDTPLFAQMKAGEFDVDEDLACEMYDELVSSATRAGFRQYEVANFAREARAHSTVHSPQSTPGGESAGGCGLWTGDNSGFRLPPQRELLARRLVLRSGTERDELRSRRADQKLVEHAALLRTAWKREARHRIQRGIAAVPARGRDGGVRVADGRRLAVRGISSARRILICATNGQAEMSQLTERGWGNMSPDHFRLTPQGLRFADSAAEMFLR